MVLNFRGERLKLAPRKIWVPTSGQEFCLWGNQSHYNYSCLCRDSYLTLFVKVLSQRYNEWSNMWEQIELKNAYNYSHIYI